MISLLIVVPINVVHVSAAGSGIGEVGGGSGGSSIATGSSSSGGSGCSMDCNAPTLGLDNRNHRIVEGGFSINKQVFDVNRYFQSIPTQIMNVDETIEINLKVFENSGVEKIQHVELVIDTFKETIQGIPVEKSQGVIIWEKDQEIKIQHNELFRDVQVRAIPINDTMMSFLFSFKITHELNPSTIKVRMWDSYRASWDNYFENALEVKETDQVTNNISEKSNMYIKVEPPFNLPNISSETNSNHSIMTQEDAIAFFDKLAQIQQEKRTALFYKAQSHTTLREFDHALDIYNNLLEKNPDDLAVLNNKAHVLISDERYYEADQVIDKILNITPDSELTLTNKAISLFNQYKYNQALDAANDALSIDSNYEFALGMKALILSEMGRHDEVQPILDKILQVNLLNVDLLTIQSMIFQNEGKYYLALHYLDRAIEINPLFHHALLKKGQILHVLGNLEESKIYLVRAEAIYPNDRDTLLSKMMAYAISDELNIAKEVSNNIKNLSDPKFVDSYLLLAKAYVKYDLDSALSMVDEILDYNLDNIPTLLLKSKILYIQNNSEDALHLINVVLDIDSNNIDAQSQLEVILNDRSLQDAVYEYDVTSSHIFSVTEKISILPEQFWYAILILVGMVVFGVLMWKRQELDKWTMKERRIE